MKIFTQYNTLVKAGELCIKIIPFSNLPGTAVAANLFMIELTLHNATGRHHNCLMKNSRHGKWRSIQTSVYISLNKANMTK